MKSFDVVYEENLLVEDFLFIRKAQNWDDLEYSQAETALNNSVFTASAKTGLKTVGFIRVTGDMATVFYIQEIGILPEYQHKGIGTELVKRAAAFIKSTLKEGWKATIRLKSMPDAKDFYENLGFISFPNENDKNSLMMMFLN